MNEQGSPLLERAKVSNTRNLNPLIGLNIGGSISITLSLSHFLIILSLFVLEISLHQSSQTIHLHSAGGQQWRYLYDL